MASDKLRRAELRSLPVRVASTAGYKMGPQILLASARLTTLAKSQATALITAIRTHQVPANAISITEDKRSISYEFISISEFTVPEALDGKVITVQIPEVGDLPSVSPLGVKIRGLAQISENEIREDPVLSAIFTGSQIVVSALELGAAGAALTASAPASAIAAFLLGSYRFFQFASDLSPEPTLPELLEAIALFFTKHLTGKVVADKIKDSYQNASRHMPLFVDEIVSRAIDLILETWNWVVGLFNVESLSNR